MRFNACFGGAPNIAPQVTKIVFGPGAEYDVQRPRAAFRGRPFNALSRMAFLEMALSGITAVGEFSLPSSRADGSGYDDLSCCEGGVRRVPMMLDCALRYWRVAYARSGFEADPNPRQARFNEGDPELFI